MSALLELQILSTFCLTGLIWVVQCVHYPSFRFIDPDKFKAFHNFHSSKITWIVAPLMVAELLSAMLLLVQHNSTFWLVQLILILLLWIATAFLSVPIHNKLTMGYNLVLINKLVFTNWPRTFLWSLKSSLLLYYLSKNF